MPYDPRLHGPQRIVGPGFHARVYAVVERVPAGSLTTYGDIAEALGMRRVARQVGFALAALPETRRDVPWHRVVQSQGSVANGRAEQVARLVAEGLQVAASGRVRDFARLRVPVDLLRISPTRPAAAAASRSARGTLSTAARRPRRP